MSIEAIFDQIPFAKELGIELEEASDGHAEARLPLREEHSSNPGHLIAHGGVYKTGGQGEETPWTEGTDLDSVQATADE